MINKPDLFWRFRIGTPESFKPRIIYQKSHASWAFVGATTPGLINFVIDPVTGESQIYQYTSFTGSTYATFTFTGTAFDLNLIRLNTYGNFILKIKPTAINTVPDVYTPLTGRSCYGNTAVASPDTIKIIENLDYDEYTVKIMPATTSDVVVITGGIVYGELSSTIYDYDNAFVFDVNPQSYDESIVGGTLEKNMNGSPILTATNLAHREMSISGSCITGWQNTKMGITKFVQNMRMKFEWYTNMQTKLYLVDDRGINHKHLVYVLPDSFSVDRRPSSGPIPTFSYSLGLREVKE